MDRIYYKSKNRRRSALIINGICVCIVFLFLTMCKKQNDNKDTTGFLMLNGNYFVLKVDRVSLAPEVQFPRDSLHESDYTHTDDDIQYEVSFSEDGQIVSINPGPVTGTKTKDGKESGYYELAGGLFAGGRFIVWMNNEVFEAEYTKYGSGIPIIRSERGKLELNE